MVEIVKKTKIDIPVLTGVRFIAAFYVFIFHVNLRMTLDFLPPVIIKFISQGAVGVNIFFILSGFILFYNYNGRKIKFKNFIFRRLAKIYPVYLFGFFLCILVYQFLGISVNNNWQVQFLNLLMLQSYFPTFSMVWYGGGSWSISTEFFFYLSFPLLLYIMNLFRKKFAILTFILMYICSFIPSILYNLDLIDWKWIYTFPPARIFEFIVGMLVALFIQKFNLKLSNLIFFITIGFTLLFVILVYGNDFLKGYVIHNVILVPIMTIFLLLVTNMRKTIFDFLGWKFFVYLGKISYSFYITQIPIMLYLDHSDVLSRFGIITNFILILAVNLFLSMVAYHLIELPFHRFFIHKLEQYKETHVKQLTKIYKNT